MAGMTKNQKIARAIELIETMSRSNWITGAIMGNNTNTLTAIELLKSASEKTTGRPRKKKTPVQTEINLERKPENVTL